MPARPRDDRMWFDSAPEVVVAGDLLVFGDSADGRVIGPSHEAESASPIGLRHICD
jgi:hypothetical protein